MMYYHETECHAEKSVHYLQSEGHSESLYYENMTISTVSSKLLVHMQPNLVWVYSIINRNVLCKNVITALKVKVTANLQNVSKCLFAYRLKRGTFCYQTSYAVAAS